MQVCIPGLHISLGVFYKLFTLLEAAAHELDIWLPSLLDMIRLSINQTSMNMGSTLRHCRRFQPWGRRQTTCLTTLISAIVWPTGTCLTVKKTNQIRALRHYERKQKEARQRAEKLVNLHIKSSHFTQLNVSQWHKTHRMRDWSDESQGTFHCRRRLVCKH